MNWKEAIILTLILLGGFVVRLYRYTNPIADWHSWRQADTSAVSRNFVTGGFDVLHPRFDDISNVQTGKLDNPQGYRFVEFPLYNVLQAEAFIVFHHFTLEEWGRIITNLISIIGAAFLFLLVKRRSNSICALFATFFFCFMPFNIYFDRTVLPDPLMVTTTLASIYYFDRYAYTTTVGKKFIFFLLSLLFCMVAFLIKPFAGFFLLPLLVIVWEKWGIQLFKQIPLYVYAVLSVAPFALWRIWMLQYPEGIPSNAWLFNGNNIRFTGAFFYWIFARRIGEVILGHWLMVPFIIGFVILTYKRAFFLSFAVGSLLYLFIVATGNVQHNYYQLPIIPTIAIFTGLGSDFLLRTVQTKISPWASRLALVVCIVFGLMFGWYYCRGFFDINNPSIIVAGEVVDRLTPKNAKVIALYNGDTSFLYQTKRKGWASFEKSLPELIAMGAEYMVIANPTQNDINGFGKQYKVLAVSSQYLLLDLHKKL